MLEHLVRRLIGGALTFFLAAFVLYTLLMYTPAGPPDIINPPPRFDAERYSTLMTNAFELDKPWPLSFLAYMYDPGETTDIIRGKAYTKGIQMRLLGAEISGSGLVTGDFGRSILIAKQVPVMEVYGPGLDLLFAVLLGMVLTFGYAATVQRAGRLAPYAQHPPSRTVGPLSCLPIDAAGVALQGRRF
jgi:hypothetical protein